MVTLLRHSLDEQGRSVHSVAMEVRGRTGRWCRKRVLVLAKQHSAGPLHGRIEVLTA